MSGPNKINIKILLNSDADGAEYSKLNFTYDPTRLTDSKLPLKLIQGQLNAEYIKIKNGIDNSIRSDIEKAVSRVFRVNDSGHGERVEYIINQTLSSVLDQYAHTCAIYFIACALEDLRENIEQNINSDQYELKKQLYNVMREWIVSIKRYDASNMKVVSPYLTKVSNQQLNEIAKELRHSISQMIGNLEEEYEQILNNNGSIVSL